MTHNQHHVPDRGQGEARPHSRTEHSAQHGTNAAAALVEWYQLNQRQLPWRETTDPYKIWVSETMLQQTRVETVIPYYHDFLKQYPTVRNLADADESEVLKLWQGLGYYSRARNLHRAAQQVVQRFGGVIPQETDDFRSLAGVGPYTTGAVQSIAFDKPIAAVDGNVLRVLARFLAIKDEVRSKSAVRTITTQVEDWLGQASPRILTQAIMELGALVCTPRKPACLTCPLNVDCLAYAEGIAEQLPVRKKAAGRQLVQVIAIWCQRDSRVLLEQRPDKGLLAGMWQLPAIEIKMTDEQAVPDRSVMEARAREILLGLFAEHEVHQAKEPSQAASPRTAGEATAAWEGTMEEAAVEEGSAASSWLRMTAKVAEPGFLEFHTVAELKHIFTHVEWRVTVLEPVGWNLDSIRTGAKRVWADKEVMAKLAVPRVYDKVLTPFLHG